MSDELPPINLDLDLGPEPPPRPPDLKNIRDQVERMIQLYEYDGQFGQLANTEWETLGDGMATDILRSTGKWNYNEANEALLELFEYQESLDEFRALINQFANEMDRHIEIKVNTSPSSGVRLLKYKVRDISSIADGGRELGGALDL